MEELVICMELMCFILEIGFGRGKFYSVNV